MADKRRKPIDPAAERALRDAMYQSIGKGEVSLGEAVRMMRQLSRLTQPEFARHRKISLDSLRAIESDNGNPTIATLRKIGSIFGLDVGFVAKIRRGQAPPF